MKKVVFIILPLAICLLLLIYAPVEIYASNIDDVDYDLYDLGKVLLILFITGFIVISGLSLAVRHFARGNFQKIWAGLLLFILSFLCMQGTFFSSNIPVLDGDSVVWSSFATDRIISIVLFLITGAAVILLLAFLDEKKFSALCIFTGTVLSSLMALSLLLMCFTVDHLTDKKDVTVTDSYILDMSENENFVILVLDGMDTAQYKKTANRHPEYVSCLEDFTFFSNTLGAYPFTKRAVPFIVSGEWFEFQMSELEYAIRSFSESPLINTLSANGYRIGMYEAEMVPHREVNLSLYENFARFESRKLVRPVLFAKLQLKLVGLKYLPWQLKPYCVVTPDQVEYDAEFANAHARAYSYDNGYFYDKVRNEPVVTGRQNCFRFIHVKGAHPPYDRNINMERISDGTFEDGIEASMTLTQAYLEKLKEAGTYDNSVIIIMADHGYAHRQNPVLFIKGKNEHHAYQENRAPVSHADLQEACDRLLNGSSAEDAFDWNEGDLRERRFLNYSIEDDSVMYEMVSNGAAVDTSALTLTGEIYTSKP